MKTINRFMEFIKVAFTSKMKDFMCTIVLISVVFGFFAGWKINDWYYDDEYNYEKLEAYQHYYIVTENMLDSVMYHYNIVEKVDTRAHGSALLEVREINELGK